MRFSQILQSTWVNPRSLAIFWIGQAGFLFKTAAGKIILVDPYLSDSVYNLFRETEGIGFKRLSPPLFEPEEVTADYLFCSHEHGDHLDREAIKPLMGNSRTLLYANRESSDIAEAAGVPGERIVRIERGAELVFPEFKLTAVAAEHGQLAPAAMGFLFDFGFVRVYYAGDTAYDRRVLAPAIEAKPEIALLPINGAYGNLSAVEAAQFAADLQAKICLPHHFWTFPKHLGNPQEFIEVLPRYAPNCRLCLTTPGEPLIWP